MTITRQKQPQMVSVGSGLGIHSLKMNTRGQRKLFLKKALLYSILPHLLQISAILILFMFCAFRF